MFTPLDNKKNRRLQFNDDEVRVISGDLHERKRGKKAEVELNIKGNWYKFEVHGTSCGLSRCMCDAFLKVA